MENLNPTTTPAIILRYYLSLIHTDINVHTDENLDWENYEIPFSKYANLSVFPTTNQYDKSGKLITEDFYDFEIACCLCSCTEEKKIIEREISKRQDEYSIDEAQDGWYIVSGQFTYYSRGIDDGMEEIQRDFRDVYDINSVENPMNVRYRLFSEVFFNKPSIHTLLHLYSTHPDFDSLSWQLYDVGKKVGKVIAAWRIILLNPLDFIEFFNKELISDRTLTSTDEPETNDTDENKGIAHQVRYFHETGVLEYLKNAYDIELSPNKVAFVVSKMLSCDIKAVQKIILASLEGDSTDNNHPEYSSTKYSAVRKNLESCGTRK